MQREKEPLRDRGYGRWPEILSALGASHDEINPRKHRRCPWCGGTDRFRFTNKGDTGAFYCGQCGPKGPVDYIMQTNGWDFAHAAKEIEAVLGETKFTPTKKPDSASQRKAMQTLWDQGKPIAAGDIGDMWFANRGIRQDNYPRCLRLVDLTDHVDEESHRTWHPAIVAKIQEMDGKPCNLHRTYLTRDGQKAPVDTVRKVMAGGIPKGAAIRLFDAGPVLGVAEGIETAFAAATLHGVPVWSTMNSSQLTGWLPPEGVQQVVIFGDNDPKYGGQAAAMTLAHRLACLKDNPVSVRVELPPIVGQDWNDVLLGRGGAA